MATKAKSKAPAKTKAKGKPRVRTKAIVRVKPEIIDPRQTSFLSGFLDPASPTYANALQSALAAGFAQEYAESITYQMPKWLSESLGKEATKSLAQKHLDEVLTLPIRTQAMGAFGPLVDKKSKKPIMVINTSIIKQKNDMAKFALEGLDRANYGRQTSKIGINFNITPSKDRYSA